MTKESGVSELLARELSVYFNDCLDGLMTKTEYMKKSNAFLATYFADWEQLKENEK